MRPQTRYSLVFILAVAAGCGSSPSKTAPTPDAAIQDAPAQEPDLPADTALVKMDAFTKLDVIKPADTKIDKPLAPDAPDFDTALPDGAVDTHTGPSPDAFVPGPIEPLLVNSGNTANFNLAEGTWKVFSFDTVAGRFYCLGALPSGVEVYYSQSPSVSPFDYNEKTNYLRALNFTSNSGGKYYIAVAPIGAGVSGSLQVSEGGDLLELGENTVEMSAPNGEATRFFRFVIAPGHSYTVSLAGDAKKPVTLSLSPLADRSTTGQFAFPLSSKSSVLPISDEPVPLESVAKSSSRLYFFYVKVQETVSLTIKITLAT